MTTIKFGTDGWRAVIARDYTFENVARAAHALAKVMQKESPGKNRMVVGYDRRFQSRAFAETAAAVYASYGYEVLLAGSALPTPAISWVTKHEAGMACGTMITASHNPAEWNGFKIKEPFGGSARPELTQKVEAVLAADGGHAKVPTEEDVAREIRTERIRIFDPMPKYLEAVRVLVDLPKIRTAGLHVGLDVMHGAAAGHYAKFLESLGVKVTELHGDDNPGFSGIAPEPIGKNLKELCTLLSRGGFSCGLATDGDADRLGAVDETGEPFTTQMILSSVYWHMITNRKKRWSIARSASTTKMVDLIAKRHGLNSFETPVGFKFIAEKMVAGEAQIGGEESGGIGIIDHLPERDGPLTGLLLLEIIAMTGKGLREIYQDICKTERPYYFIRHDLHLSAEKADASLARLKSDPPSSWCERKVDVLSKLDGFKFYFKDGGWLLIRKSGTEPIYRLYAEAETLAASQQLVDAAKAYVER